MIDNDDGYTPATRPWRSLIRVVEISDTHFNFVLPGWDAHHLHSAELNGVPSFIADAMRAGPLPFRCYAYCNIGANSPDDLQYNDWKLL